METIKMDNSSALDAEDCAAEPVAGHVVDIVKTESEEAELFSVGSEKDAVGADIYIKFENSSEHSQASPSFTVSVSPKENPHDGVNASAVQRTQPRRSSRRQNCVSVTLSLELEEKVYDRWLCIGSTNRLKSDAEIALFLMHQLENYEKVLSGLPTGATCVGCNKPLILTCSKCHIASQTKQSPGVKNKSTSEPKNVTTQGNRQAARGTVQSKSNSSKPGNDTRNRVKLTNTKKRQFSDSDDSGGVEDDGAMISDEGTEDLLATTEDPKLQILRVVKQEDLLDFFDSVPEISKANMLRKGRFLTSPGLVAIVKGRNGFLSDIFQRQDGVECKRKKVVCREILQCDGRGQCQRACGGLGECAPGCDKDGIRRSVGHHCSFRVHLKMYSTDIGKWEVSTQGRHVPPYQTWKPSPNKSVLRDPRIRAQYEEAYKGGVTSAEDMLSIMCTEARASKKQYYSFMRTMKRRRQRNKGCSSESATDHLAYQTLPMGVQDCADDL